MRTAKKSILIAKHDGTQELFAPAKLRRMVAVAMRACHYDPKLSEPLVQAVEVHLQYWDEPRPPTSEYLFRCVQAVLKQTGLSDVADVLAAHRRWRRVKRHSVQVQRRHSKRGPRPWRKAALVTLLEKRYGVMHDTARIIAGELEMRVLNLGYRVITAGLLEELVHNELLTWGLLGEQVEMPRAARRAPQA